jgi:hypothetical protein
MMLIFFNISKTSVLLASGGIQQTYCCASSDILTSAVVV